MPEGAEENAGPREDCRDPREGVVPGGVLEMAQHPHMPERGEMRQPNRGRLLLVLTHVMRYQALHVAREHTSS